MRLTISLLLALLLADCSPALAEPKSIYVYHSIHKFQEPDYSRLADAIYKAEGGNKTTHPYGIMRQFKHTSPKQACLNICRNNYQRWASNSKGMTYLTYLSKVYCPYNSEVWLKNVRWFLKQKRGMK